MSSIREVAKEAGVSPATVSRTFSTPELINEQTQKRVLEAARLLNYRPPRLRSTKPHRTPVESPSGTIGFVFFAGFAEDALLSNNFYAPVLSGALAEADSQGVHLLVHTTDRHSIGQEMPRMVRERVVLGMLLVGTPDAAILEQFAECGFPVVLVDTTDNTGTFESVVSDGFGGAFEATRYLQTLGHRQIGFFLPEENVYTFSDRLYGYLAAHYEVGLVPEERLIIRGFTDNSLQEEPRIAVLTELLQRPDRPTALVCANDENAILALRVSRQLGLRVPDDLSLVGFDDIQFSSSIDPPLTTVRVDKERMGRLAIHRLLTQVQRKTEINTGRIQNRLPVSLVIRGSCRSIIA